MTKTKILNHLVKMVCEKEKGKKQLNAGQARECLKIIINLLYNDATFELFAYDYHTKKKAKKK
jgi:hypothetical protein